MPSSGASSRRGGGTELWTSASIDLEPEFLARLRRSEHDSALGRWRETLCLPPPELASAVALSWLGEGRTTYRRDRRLPRGVGFLLVNLGPPALLFGADGSIRELRDLFFCGQQESYLETAAPQGTVMLGVAFTATGAHRIISPAQGDYSGQVVELAAGLGDGVRGLRERLLATAGADARLRVVECWLLDRLRRGRAVHPVTRWAAAEIAAHAGVCRIGEIANRAGFSRQYLHQRFRREVGIGPKSYARILRFQRAFAALRSGGARGAELAVACGYYDQSHWTHECRELSGCTPAELALAPTTDPATLALA